MALRRRQARSESRWIFAYCVDTWTEKICNQRLMKRLISGLPLLLFTATTLLAQSASPDDTGVTASATPEIINDKAAAAGIAAIFGGFCLIWLVFLAIWLMKDAKRRQSPNKTLVTVLAWIPATTVIGLIVHLVTRPKTIPGAPNP